jgi:hypothetical protein
MLGIHKGYFPARLLGLRSNVQSECCLTARFRANDLNHLAFGYTTNTNQFVVKPPDARARVRYGRVNPVPKPVEAQPIALLDLGDSCLNNLLALVYCCAHFSHSLQPQYG